MSEEKKVDFFMPLYIGDYLGDTMELDAETSGAYLFLLMSSWRRGGRLPSDQAQLAVIARVRPKRWLYVWGMIARYFQVDGDELYQPRLVRELAAAKRFRGDASKAGKASAVARRLRDGTAQPNSTRSHGSGSADPRTSFGGRSGTRSPNAPEDPQPQPQSDPDPPGGGSGSAPVRAEVPGGPGPGIRESAPPAANGAATTAFARWSGGKWLERFRAAYWDAKGRQYGRGESDARAATDLTDRLVSIDDAARAGLEAGAVKVFAAYFAMGGGVETANHPFKWLVERFNEWGDWAAGKGPAAPRRTSGYVTVRGRKDWHAGMDKVKT